MDRQTVIILRSDTVIGRQTVLSTFTERFVICTGEFFDAGQTQSGRWAAEERKARFGIRLRLCRRTYKSDRIEKKCQSHNAADNGRLHARFLKSAKRLSGPLRTGCAGLNGKSQRRWILWTATAQ